MKLGIKVQPLRGVVAIRGYAGDARFPGTEAALHKVVLDVQVLSQETVEELRAGRLTDQLLAENLCHAFADDLEALFKKYGLEVFPRGP